MHSNCPDTYQDYPDFFTYIASFATIQIQFDFQVENSLSLEVEPCSTQCSCQHCLPACTEQSLPSDICLVKFWGRDWECVTLSMTAAYIAFALLGFAGIVFSLVMRSKAEANLSSSVGPRTVGTILILFLNSTTKVEFKMKL
jgi:hypothetical protein